MTGELDAPEEESEQAQHAPPFLDTLGAALRQVNIVGSLTDAVHHPPPDAAPVPGYDPMQHVPAGYEEDAPAFLHAHSPAQTAYIQNRTDDEREDKRTIARAGLGGFAAAIAAGATDPVTLASMVIPGGQGTWLARAGRTAAIMAGGTAVQEVALHQLQQTRTIGESIENVAFSPLLPLGLEGAGKVFAIGGRTVLRGILGRMARNVPPEELNRLGDAVNQDLHPPPPAGEPVLRPGATPATAPGDIGSDAWLARESPWAGAPGVLGERRPSVLRDLPSDLAPAGVARADAERVAQEISQGQKAFPPVTVHEDISTLPEHIRQAIERDQAEGTTGAVYDPKTGEVHAIAGNNGSLEELRENLWHEAVGHHGLRLILDPEEYRQITDGIWRDMPERAQAAAVRNSLDVHDPAQRGIAAEEVVAYAAGRIMTGQELEKPLIPVWQRVLRAAKGFFSRAFGGEYFDDRTIASLVARSARAVREGAPAGELGSAAGGLRSQRAPVWYSPTARAVELSTQAKASPEQWLATLKRAPGIKNEELDWLGLEKWLKGHRRAVTREELQDYLRANQLELQETVKGGQQAYQGFVAFLDKVEALRQQHEGAHYEIQDALRLIRNKAAGGNVEGVHLGLDLLSEAEREHGGGDDPISRELREQAANTGFTAKPGEVRYSEHQLPGADPGSYHEMLIQLPPQEKAENVAERAALQAKLERGEFTHEDYQRFQELRQDQVAAESQGQYESGHWFEPNVLGHVRFSGRTDTEGKRTLLLEELQSDWHQEGRKRGYSETAARVRDSQLVKSDVPVPDAPYKTTWPQLIMRRMIRWAAENGYERVAWTTGEIQGERWGRGLEEGMSGFYDKILPAETNKTIRKYGAKVGTKNITVPEELVKDAEGIPIEPPGEDKTKAVHSFDITPEMRTAALSEGMPLFARKVQQPRPEGERIASGGRTIAATLGKFAPSMRVMRSPSLVSRVLLQKLANIPEELAKNAGWFPTEQPVEREIWKIPRMEHEITDRIEQHYRAYLQRVTGRSDFMTRNLPPSGTFTRLQFNEAVGHAMSNSESFPGIQEVEDAAKDTRRGYNEITQRSQAAGALPQQLRPVLGASSYFPRIANILKMQRQMTAWLELLEQGFRQQGEDPAEANRIAHQVTHVYLHYENGPETWAALDQALKAGHFKERTLNLPDNLLEPFMHKDASYVTGQWLRQIMPEVMFREKFGNADLEAQLQEVRDDYIGMIEKARSAQDPQWVAQQEQAIRTSPDPQWAAQAQEELRQAREPRRVEKLRQGLASDMDDLRAMRERLFNRHMRPEDPASWTIQTIRNLRDLNVLNKLGSAQLSHITDIGNTMLRYGAPKTLQAWAQLTASVRGELWKVAIEEAHRAGVAYETAHNITSMALGDYGNLPRSPVAQVLGGLTRGFGIPGTNVRIPGFTSLTLETPMIDRTQTVAAMLASDEILRAAETHAQGGTLANATVRQLASAGIDEAMLQRFAAQLQHTQTVGEFRFGRTDRWTDPQAASAFHSAILKDAHAVTLRPGVGDTPNFMSNELYKLLFQFTNFAFAARAVQSRIGQGLAHGDVNAISGLFGLLGLGYLTYALKQQAAGMPRASLLDNPGRVMLEVADRTNTLAIASRALPLLWELGNRDLSRWSDSDAAEVLFGPAVGTLAAAWQRRLPAKLERSLGLDVDSVPFSRSDLHFLRRLAPAQNLWYARVVISHMEDWVGDQFDLPGLSQRERAELEELAGTHD